MKHLFLILTLLLIVFQQSIYSQEYCFTPPPTISAYNAAIINNSNQSTSAPLRLRVYFHVVRKSDGTGGYSQPQVEASLSVLQGHFNGHGIYFEWDGCINYINRDSFFYASSVEEFGGLFTTDNHGDGIDLYLNLNDSFRGGAANGIGTEGSSELWVSGLWGGPTALNSTISHEMGHVLSLYHTFEGCREGMWELIDGSNCETAGDLVCDTDADPNMNFNVNSNCEWDGVHIDGYCFPPLEPLSNYTPDPLNIMAYSRPQCREYFTDGQGERMLMQIYELQHLLDCIITGTTVKQYCHCPTEDVVITENTVFDQDLHITGDLIILNSAELTIQNTVYFNQGHGVKIDENSKIILTGATLTACDDEWKGIRVINGELEARDSYILNAKIGIKAKNGTTLDLNDVEISGSNGQFGVYLKETVNLISFEDIKIQNYYFGIYGINNTGFYDFNKGEILNTTYGIYLHKSVVLISDYTIEASNTGIYMNACHFSYINTCDIEFGFYGINARNSDILEISNNTVGSHRLNGRTAIKLINCENANIFSNPEVYATKYGIRTFQSNATINGNTIVLSGHNNTAGGGIQINNETNAVISNNFITANYSSFGIESIGGQNNDISHNNVSVTTAVAKRAAVIRTMGGLSESIDNNIIDGHGTIAGIIAQNSTANTYDCNDISNTITGLAILNNSEGQDIKGNEFLSSTIDLTIQSVIGQQNYTGNEFVNGSARAIGLDVQDILDSRFFVNGTIINANHMPSDPIPGNGQWFVNDPDEEDYYDECESPGPFVKFHDDADKLADYFDKVKLLQNEQPNVFYTKLYDLLKYEQEMVEYTLPDNIKNDAVFTNVCGVEELVNMSGQLNDLLLSNNEWGVDYQDIRSLQNEYVLATEVIDRGVILNDLNQSLALLAPTIEYQLIADSMALFDIKIDLENINCAGAYVEKWKDIYTIYIEYIQTGEIAEKQQKALIEYSQECSDKYGDVIHIARALANTFDDTYFDIYDDCLEENKIKSIRTTDNSLNAFIQPNPSKGTIVLHTEDEVTGIIKVIDLTGRVVHTDNMTDAYQHTLNLDLNEGIYYIYLTTSKGAVFVEKIVITK